MDIDADVKAYVAKRYQPMIFAIVTKRFESFLAAENFFEHVEKQMPDLHVPVSKEIFQAAIEGMTLKDIVTFDEAASEAALREKKPASASGVFTITRSGLTATGDFDRETGAMTLRAGSQITPAWSQAKSDSAAFQIHKHLVGSDLIEDRDDDPMTLNEDITVSSPALAASLVLGGNHPTSQWKAAGTGEDLVTEASRKAACFTWKGNDKFLKMTENGQQDA